MNARYRKALTELQLDLTRYLLQQLPQHDGPIPKRKLPKLKGKPKPGALWVADTF